MERDRYVVYFDRTEFFTYHHRVDLELVEFFEATADGSAGRIDSVFIS